MLGTLITEGYNIVCVGAIGLKIGKCEFGGGGGKGYDEHAVWAATAETITNGDAVGGAFKLPLDICVLACDAVGADVGGTAEGENEVVNIYIAAVAIRGKTEGEMTSVAVIGRETASKLAPRGGGVETGNSDK